MSRRSGLGRGLSSLIPADFSADGGVYQEIDVKSVVPNPYQPREHFDEETLASLSKSIAEIGIVQPIVVREIKDGQYELIAGERRWRAAKRADLSAIPAIVRTSDDLSSLEAAVVENLHRQDLNALEEAAAYQQLVEEFNLTQDDVAQRVGKSRSAVANTLRLLHLPPMVQRLLVEGRLSAGHARALLATPDRSEQERLAALIVDEGLTVRQIEEVLRAEDPAEASGEDETPAKKVIREAPAAGVLELEELLAARLDTRVAVKLGKGPGKLVVDFADVDDLERIYRIIAGQ
ncbi:MAG: ParB/RepB/Spo0J family partition protein [Acidimicrobiaceae bacterium]|nr:ParB/RepB/Spo0J family partition protein [Acidimicrobiaceae bacterium]MDE0608278.1 ParB/RepB/Spo0J family partition protein [Acidimicrobiaceae bacterium]